MSNEAITPFDIEGAAKRVKAQIHAAWSALIPDEQLEQMARAELQVFLKEEFPKICRQEFETFVRAKVKEHLASPEWATVWRADPSMPYGGSYGPPQAIAEWLEKNQQNIVKLVITDLFSSSLNMILERVRNGR